MLWLSDIYISDEKEIDTRERMVGILLEQGARLLIA